MTYHYKTERGKRVKVEGPRPVWAVTFSDINDKTTRKCKSIYTMSKDELDMAWLHLEKNIMKADERGKRLPVRLIKTNCRFKVDEPIQCETCHCSCASRKCSCEHYFKDKEIMYDANSSKRSDIKRDIKAWRVKQVLIEHAGSIIRGNLHG